MVNLLYSGQCHQNLAVWTFLFFHLCLYPQKKMNRKKKEDKQNEEELKREKNKEEEEWDEHKGGRGKGEEEEEEENKQKKEKKKHKKKMLKNKTPYLWKLALCTSHRRGNTGRGYCDLATAVLELFAWSFLWCWWCSLSSLCWRRLWLL